MDTTIAGAADSGRIVPREDGEGCAECISNFLRRRHMPI